MHQRWPPEINLQFFSFRGEFLLLERGKVADTRPRRIYIFPTRVFIIIAAKGRSVELQAYTTASRAFLVPSRTFVTVSHKYAGEDVRMKYFVLTNGANCPAIFHRQL